VGRGKLLHTSYGAIARLAIHYTHQHPEVTFHTAARLDAIERHLRCLVAHFGAEPVPTAPPLSRQWLADLVAFANAEPDPPSVNDG
jgi:hypothetical protein